MLEVCETQERGRHGHFASIAKNWPEAEANARLIAAAPDLLAALRIFTDFPSDVFEGEEDGPYTMTVRLDDMRRARAAIAKAEGA